MSGPFLNLKAARLKIVNFVNLKIARLASVDWEAADLDATDLNFTPACICSNGGVDARTVACICTSADACARADTGSTANAGNVSVGSVALGDACTAVLAAMGDAKQPLFCEPSLNLKRA